MRKIKPMKKNSTKELNKSRLANYSAVAGAVLATGAVNGQITYVDVNPDAVVNNSNSPYNLDMNNDANPDMIFEVQAVSQSGSYSSWVFLSHTIFRDLMRWLLLVAVLLL
jgi:hypothetical protein